MPTGPPLRARAITPVTPAPESAPTIREKSSNVLLSVDLSAHTSQGERLNGKTFLPG